MWLPRAAHFYRIAWLSRKRFGRLVGQKSATLRLTIDGLSLTLIACALTPQNWWRWHQMYSLAISTAALLGRTRTIPIVFARVADPLGSGFVESFARPGHNATGFSNHEVTMGGKWVELLKEIVPSVARVALIYNPRTAPFTVSYLPSLESAARLHGIKLIDAAVDGPAELETVVAAQAAEPGGSLVAQTDAFVTLHRDLIISLTARHRLPAIYPARSFVEAGGLASYGNASIEMYRGAAAYVDLILRGA